MKLTFWEATKANLRGLRPYLIAAVIYITIGVIQPKFVLNWTPAYLLLLLVIWIIPALWQRWRGR